MKPSWVIVFLGIVSWWGAAESAAAQIRTSCASGTIRLQAPPDVDSFEFVFEDCICDPSAEGAAREMQEFMKVFGEFVDEGVTLPEEFESYFLDTAQRRPVLVSRGSNRRELTLYCYTLDEAWRYWNSWNTPGNIALVQDDAPAD